MDGQAVQHAAGFSQDNKVGRLLSSVGSTGMKSSCKQQIFSVGREEPPLTVPAAQHLVSSRVGGGVWVLSERETLGAALVHL